MLEEGKLIATNPIKLIQKPLHTSINQVIHKKGAPLHNFVKSHKSLLDTRKKIDEVHSSPISTMKMPHSIVWNLLKSQTAIIKTSSRIKR